MNKRRLLKLAGLLERDAKRKTGIQFDLNTWGDVSNPEKPVSCGTQACAMGLAALSGEFKRAGLKASVNGYGGVEFNWNGRNTGDGILVAQRLFDISDDDASQLFYASRYRTTEGAVAERAVAKRIRALVAGEDIHEMY